jgi:hypothetical protein
MTDDDDAFRFWAAQEMVHSGRCPPYDPDLNRTALEEGS